MLSIHDSGVRHVRRQLSQLAKDLVARTKTTGRSFSSQPEADMQAALELMTQEDMDVLHEAVGPESCVQTPEPPLHQGPVDEAPLTARERSALQQQDALGKAILKRASVESGLMTPVEADKKFGMPERSMTDGDPVGYSAAREVGKAGKKGTWMSASTVPVRKPATGDTATADAPESSPVDRNQQPLSRASPAEDAAAVGTVIKSSAVGKSPQPSPHASPAEHATADVTQSAPVADSRQPLPRASLSVDEGSAGRAEAGAGDSTQAEAGQQPQAGVLSSALSEPREQEGKQSAAEAVEKSDGLAAAEDSSEPAFKVMTFPPNALMALCRGNAQTLGRLWFETHLQQYLSQAFPHTDLHHELALDIACPTVRRSLDLALLVRCNITNCTVDSEGRQLHGPESE